MEHKDVMGIYLDTETRYEVDNVQFVADMLPENIERGGRTMVRVFLQNTLDAPVSLRVWVRPADKELSEFSSLNKDTSYTAQLEPGEFGKLLYPIDTSTRLTPVAHRILVRVEAKSNGGSRIVGKKEKGGDYPELAEALGSPGKKGTPFKTVNAREVKLRLNVNNLETKSIGKTPQWNWDSIWDLEDTRNLPRAIKYVDQYFGQLTSDKMSGELLDALEKYIGDGMDFLASPLFAGERNWLTRWMLDCSDDLLNQGEASRGILIDGTLACLRNGGMPSGPKIALNMVIERFPLLLENAGKRGAERQNKHYQMDVWPISKTRHLFDTMDVGGDLRDHLIVVWSLHIKSALLFYNTSPFEELDLMKSLESLQNDYHKRKRSGNYTGDPKLEAVLDEMLTNSLEIEVLE